VDRRTTRRFGLLATVIVGAVAGAALLASRPAPGIVEPTGAAAPTGSAGAMASAESTGTAEASGTTEATATAEATGVVVAVDSGGGFGNVRGFTLRVAGGELLTFSLRELQNGGEFPPGHLVQHQADAFPVLVLYRMEGSERLALRLEDAPP
jgi:hypothetical protein